MNRKAQFASARKTIYWMIVGFVITIVIIAFMMIIVGYKNKLTQISPKLKGELIALRFTNIPECLAYQDPVSERIYPGIIDLNKFTNEHLAGCYSTDPEKGFKEYNFGLHLAIQNKFIYTNNYFNKDDFTIIKEVLVKDNNKLTKDDLLIFVQTRIGEPDPNFKGVKK